jgi:Rrf2 family protein
MLVPSKKSQYALRAMFELAKRYAEGPTKISQIAEAQAIPIRFLEVILNQLKASGLVQSKRGFYGGYFLVRSPREISIGDIMRFMQRSLEPAECLACVSKKGCPFDNNCAFSGLWRCVKDAVYQIYDRTSMQDLLGANPSQVKLRS